jgi:hypothetical protein
VTRVLVVTGPVGVGKTTVGWEIAEVLEERDIRYCFFDPDALHFHPRPPDDRFGYRVSLAALDAAWPLMGVERLIIPIVVERRSALDHFADAEVTVVRLTAPADVLEQRIRKREIGAGLDWHLARSAELTAHWSEHPVEDFVVETEGRTVREIADEIVARSRWI